MLLPKPRGPLSETLFGALRSGTTAHLAAAANPAGAEDAQLTLWVLYEIHHRGFDDVSDELEWDPHLIGVRRRLEADLEQTLRSRAPELPIPETPATFAETFSTSSPITTDRRWQPTYTGPPPKHKYTNSCATNLFTILKNPTTPRGSFPGCLTR